MVFKKQMIGIEKMVGSPKICYLVAAHTASPEREDLLFNLLTSLKKSGNDIILIQHNSITQRIQEMVNYCIFDAKNEVLNYYPNKGGDGFNIKLYWNAYADNDRIYVQSKYASNLKYHGLAALSLFFHGLISAKTLGYDICHLIEYDTGLKNLDEFIENEKILSETNATSVFYKLGPGETVLYPQCSSYKLTSYSFEELNWYEKRKLVLEIIQRDAYGINNGMIEAALYEILHSGHNKNPFKKDSSNFSKNNIEIDLSGRYIPEDVLYTIPYVLSDNTERVGIFTQYYSKKKDGTRKLRFIVNDRVINRDMSSDGEWFYFDVSSLDELYLIEFYVDGVLHKKYDFVNEIDKEHFKKHSTMYLK